MRIMLTGAQGQLGSDLHQALQGRGYTVLPLNHADVDVTDAAQVDEAIVKARPDVFINTAAFHKVEECERQPDAAFGVNAAGALNLAKVCGRLGIVLVHFSTDYVFDGSKPQPYLETDLPAPLNVYGASKVAGEHLIAANLERAFVVRTSGLYGLAGSSGKGGNFVETMLRKAREGSPIRVVDDQVLTPTSTRDLADVVCQLFPTEAYGLYHVSSEGQCSWYEFARKIFELQGFRVDLQPVATSQFPSPARRPAYSVMNKSKLRGVGLVMPPWDVSLSRYLKSRAMAQEFAPVAGGLKNPAAAVS
ncbi:MAG TPA: dTDP-4-dehydrorhamnose reductase [Terriglobia bacterium]|nr:dTDP-4-dehydrorhamnose reductase [Terriglobia bacterium]